MNWKTKKLRNSRIDLVAAIILVFIGTGVRPVSAESGFRIEAESGAAFGGYNDVEIPQGSGTRFSLTDDLDLETKVYYRLRASYRINGRHEILGLFAPLTLKANGSVNRQVDFEGTTFPASTPLDAEYTFNSYRLTYRYHFGVSEKIDAAIGFTGKIRDAAVRLASASEKAEKTNVGFVPLISFLFTINISDKVRFYIDGDALAAPQGRAEDVKAAFEFDTGQNVSFNLGYRILEGGADVDEVYNFALVHYAAAGISFRF